MTLGTRDSRKILGRYDLTGEDVRGEARFADSVGIFPEFVDGCGLLLLPTTGATSRCLREPRAEEVDNLLVAGRCVAGDKVSTRPPQSDVLRRDGASRRIAAAVSLANGPTTAQWTYGESSGAGEARGAAG